jgi:hypothetical protein
LTATLAAAPRPISIYVGPTTSNGFVNMDAGVRDSIADVQRALARTKRFVIVDRPEQATLVLRVVGRGVPGTAGAVGVSTGALTVLAPIDRHALTATLQVGAYTRTLTVDDTDGRTWSYLGTALARDVTAWVDANADRLPE